MPVASLVLGIFAFICNPLAVQIILAAFDCSLNNTTVVIFEVSFFATVISAILALVLGTVALYKRTNKRKTDAIAGISLGALYILFTIAFLIFSNSGPYNLIKNIFYWEVTGLNHR